MIGALCPKCGSCFCSCSPDYSAIATSERPDRASGDSGTQELIAEIDALAERAMVGRLKALPCGSYSGLCADLIREQAEGVTVRVVPDPVRGAYDEFCLYAALVNAWPRLRDAIKTASSANGNAVAGESPDARDAKRWISVNERLPVHNDVVIVPGGIALWQQPRPEWPDGKFFTLTGERWPGKPIQWEVTHWMPLPEPPVDAAMRSPTDDEERK